MDMKKLFIAVLSALLLTACSSSNKEKISGAGATFPQPFYNIVFKKYKEVSNNEVTYGAVGSGGGIRSLQDKTVDFGATDVFLSDEELKEMGGEIIHVPTALGAVVMAYNLPGIKDLKLTAEVISDIYRGVINKWNDEKIKAINPNLELPDKDITAVYRSDGSGTTYVFSDYMSKADDNWKNEIGSGKSLTFSDKKTTKVAAKGNPGVAGIIAKTEGSIGYIGSEYALAVNIPSALIKNSSGSFIAANDKSISEAASIDIPGDTRIMITNSSNPDAYPISTFTWIIVYKEQSYNNRTAEKARALVDLLAYIISDEGQDIAAKIHYAPLSKVTIEKTKENIASITFGGTSIEPLNSK
jgi:phosphate transport system substrate-binding protein